MIARALYMRLRRVMLPDFRRNWEKDVEASATRLQETIEELRQEVQELRAMQSGLLVAELDRRDSGLLATVKARLETARTWTHIADALRCAVIDPQPTPHMVVPNILPDDVYQLLLESMPPQALFSRHDLLKQDFEMDALPGAPRLSHLAWSFFDQQIVAGIVTPLLLERFGDAVARHYGGGEISDFGRQATAIGHRSFAGRIQLRRPGYELKPHLDPKRVVITGLFYFASPGDSEAYGTQLFEVDRPFVQSEMKTFFPEQHGLRCTLARTVPYRPNTLFAFVNSAAAHGATLPVDAPLKERYAYQFYVKPDDGELKRLLRDLPEEARAAWAGFLS
jgi:hypothetical protein